MTPATRSRLLPSSPAGHQPMLMTSQLRISLSLARPIGQPLRGSRVLSRESVRRVVRSYFVSSGFTSELVLGMPCAGSVPPSKPGRPQKDHFRASGAPSSPRGVRAVEMSRMTPCATPKSHRRLAAGTRRSQRAERGAKSQSGSCFGASSSTSAPQLCTDSPSPR